MNWRNRWTFWAFALAVLALISVPSADWIATLNDYARFASGWEPSPLKPTHTTFTPRDDRAVVEEAELRPVEFRHRARRAQSVELVGDFDAWKPGLFKMRRDAAGVWTVVVPLRPGRHKYLFLEDGHPVVEPGVETAAGPSGRRVAVRTIH